MPPRESESLSEEPVIGRGQAVWGGVSEDEADEFACG